MQSAKQDTPVTEGTKATAPHPTDSHRGTSDSPNNSAHVALVNNRWVKVIYDEKIPISMVNRKLMETMWPTPGPCSNQDQSRLAKRWQDKTFWQAVGGGNIHMFYLIVNDTLIRLPALAANALQTDCVLGEDVIFDSATTWSITTLSGIQRKLRDRPTPHISTATMQQSYRALQNATLIAKAIILRAPTATFDITPGCLSAEVANRGSVQRRHEWHEGALVEIVPTLEEVEAANAKWLPTRPYHKAQQTEGNQHRARPGEQPLSTTQRHHQDQRINFGSDVLQFVAETYRLGPPPWNKVGGQGHSTPHIQQTNTKPGQRGNQGALSHTDTGHCRSCHQTQRKCGTEQTRTRPRIIPWTELKRGDQTHFNQSVLVAVMGPYGPLKGRTRWALPYVLAMVDCSTMQSEYIPIRHNCAREVVRKMQAMWTSKFSHPQTWAHDPGMFKTRAHLNYRQLRDDTEKVMNKFVHHRAKTGILPSFGEPHFRTNSTRLPMAGIIPLTYLESAVRSDQQRRRQDLHNHRQPQERWRLLHHLNTQDAGTTDQGISREEFVSLIRQHAAAPHEHGSVVADTDGYSPTPYGDSSTIGCLREGEEVFLHCDRNSPTRGRGTLYQGPMRVTVAQSDPSDPAVIVNQYHKCRQQVHPDNLIRAFNDVKIRTEAINIMTHGWHYILDRVARLQVAVTATPTRDSLWSVPLRQLERTWLSTCGKCCRYLA